MIGAELRNAQGFEPSQPEGVAPAPIVNPQLGVESNITFFPQPTGSRYYRQARELIRRMPIREKPVSRVGNYSLERGTGDILLNARQQLIDLGDLESSNPVVDILFTESGEWKHVDESGTNFFDMEPEDAFVYVMGFLQPEFKAITTYLDEPNSPERPYNEHGEKHAEETKEKARELLLHGGHIGPFAEAMRPSFKYPLDVTPKQLELYSNIAAAIHDIGYVLGDDIHPDASIMLAQRIFPQLTQDPKAWGIIQSAVHLHEGDNMRNEMERRGITTPSGVVDFLEKQYPVIAALQLADKAGQHLGRTRGSEILGKKEKLGVNPTDFLEDSHVENNALMPIKFADWETRLYKGGRTEIVFRVQTEFTQEINDDDAESYSYYTKPRSSRDGVKLAVSRRTRDQYLQAQEAGEDIEYFDILKKQALDLGATRYLAMVYASFALNPAQNMAELVFLDPDLNNTRRPGLRRRDDAPFTRQTLDDDVQRYWYQVVPESRQAKRTPEELKI